MAAEKVSRWIPGKHFLLFDDLLIPLVHVKKIEHELKVDCVV
jgi:hypothetical protein